jgi:hypothetical protein
MEPEIMELVEARGCVARIVSCNERFVDEPVVSVCAMEF